MVISFMNFPKAGEAEAAVVIDLEGEELESKKEALSEAMEEEQVDAEAHADQQKQLEACLLGQTFV